MSLLSGPSTRGRKAKKSPSPSPTSGGVASRTRHGLSKHLGKSPLSQPVVVTDGLGLSVNNPVIVEEVPIEISSHGVKRQKRTEKVSMCFYIVVTIFQVH